MSKKYNKKKILLLVNGVVAVLIVVFCVAGVLNYLNNINHKDPSAKIVNVEIKEGDSLDSISNNLQNKGVIKSKNAFKLYARINKKTDIKSGKYELSASKNIPEVLDILNKGSNIKNVTVTFLPGGTVKMAKKALSSLGYSDEEIDEALKYDYSEEMPELFADKPKEADLEGFLWGETHTFNKNTDVKTIIRRFLKDFENYVVDNNLKSKFNANGLNMYQGITLASIVQKESLGDSAVGKDESLKDKKMIAGVFMNRMKRGMNLGSDVTYQYISDKNGSQRDVNLNSPYNLRINKGLTPTPISTPGKSALEAVANPDKNNFLFFLSGDDDKTYFATTDAEHQKNIKDHCEKKCKIV